MSIATSLIRPVLRQSSILSRISVAHFASSSFRPDETPSSTKFRGKKKQVMSTCIAGTVLHGLSILKDESDPIAKADEEYPEWLWTILPAERSSSLADAEKEVPKAGQSIDFDREHKRLRALNRSNIKATNFLKGQ